MFRRLRLTATVVCFAMVIALVMLMVRSYWWFDMCSYASKTTRNKYVLWHTSSFGGFVRLSYSDDSDEIYAVGWTARALVPTEEVCNAYLVDQSWISLTAQVQRSGRYTGIYTGITHWVLAAFLGLLGLLFAKGRAAFSLRTALVATTTFGLLLGLHVSLQRAFNCRKCSPSSIGYERKRDGIKLWLVLRSSMLASVMVSLIGGIAVGEVPKISRQLVLRGPFRVAKTSSAATEYCSSRSSSADPCDERDAGELDAQPGGLLSTAIRCTAPTCVR